MRNIFQWCNSKRIFDDFLAEIVETCRVLLTFTIALNLPDEKTYRVPHSVAAAAAFLRCLP